MLPHAWPQSKPTFVGEQFEVDSGHVYLHSKKLIAARLDNKVKHKNAQLGSCKPSLIRGYGVELEYLEDIALTTRLWFYKKCYLNRELNDAKAIYSTN